MIIHRSLCGRTVHAINIKSRDYYNPIESHCAVRAALLHPTWVTEELLEGYKEGQIIIN